MDTLGIKSAGGGGSGAVSVEDTTAEPFGTNSFSQAAM